MQAKAGVIDLLNSILTADLTAVNQYFPHSIAFSGKSVGRRW
jgi:bacterioferritin (cytochrome b1)